MLRQPEFRVVSTASGVDADVERGQANLPRRDRRQLGPWKFLCRRWGDLDLERGRCLLFGGECLACQKPLMEVIGARRVVVVAALAVEATGMGEGCCRNEQQRWE